MTSPVRDSSRPSRAVARYASCCKYRRTTIEEKNAGLQSIVRTLRSAYDDLGGRRRSWYSHVFGRHRGVRCTRPDRRPATEEGRCAAPRKLAAVSTSGRPPQIATRPDGFRWLGNLIEEGKSVSDRRRETASTIGMSQRLTESLSAMSDEDSAPLPQSYVQTVPLARTVPSRKGVQNFVGSNAVDTAG